MLLSSIRPLTLLRSSWGILAVLYLLYAVAAPWFPLIGDLHYELAAVTALLASLLSGTAAIYAPLPPIPAMLTDADAEALRRTMESEKIWKNVSIASALSLIPLVAALIGSLFGANCGVGEGVAWYLILVPPSAAISVVIATLAETITRRRWRALLIFTALWSASLLRGGFEGYSGPHIFMYAWQVGFFPGGSWDAELPITTRLLIYRAAHLVIAMALALLITAIRRDRAAEHPRPKSALITLGSLLAIVSIILIVDRPALGLTRTDGWLREELGDSLRTRFATIYYNAPATDSLDLWRAANLTDFYITEIAAALRLPESRIEHITIYLYPTPAVEKEMVGTSSAAFTKPWRRTLNMTFGGVGSTLRHELAHVVIAPFGNPLGVSLSQGLLEGSAMALENDYSWRTLHEYVRAMYAFKLAPEAEQVMSVGDFTSRRSSVAYVLSGSFSLWLIERHGIERYLRAFPWSDFEDAYGRSLPELSAEYRRFIDSLPPPDPSQEPAMRNLFGGGSFFLQKCLRRMGTLNGAGFEALAGERYDDALERFRESIAEGINYGARAGILQALVGLGRPRELLDSSLAYARDTASYPLLPYLVERGDAYWALDDTANAKRLYDSVIALDISQGTTLRAALRRYFIDTNDTLTAIMRTYFTRPMKLTQRILTLDAALAVTSPSDERLVLSLLRANLTAPSLPATTLGDLGSEIRAHLPLFIALHEGSDSLSRRDALLHFIIRTHASRLRDLAIYGRLLKLPADAGKGIEFIEGFALENDPRYLLVPEAKGYLLQRRDEGERFRDYLARRVMIP